MLALWSDDMGAVNKRWRNTVLYVLLGFLLFAGCTSFLVRPDPANTIRTLRYSDFEEAVEANEVAQVLIAPDRGTAHVVERNGRRSVVNLAPDKDLLKLLTDHDVDIAVQPSSEPPPWKQTLDGLGFPLLLMRGFYFFLLLGLGFPLLLAISVGLFILLRRDHAGGALVMNTGKNQLRVPRRSEVQLPSSDSAARGTDQHQ